MQVSTQKLNLNLDVKSLTSLLEELGYPNPDDPDGDWGPIGPIVPGIDYVALNPQPLPPKWTVEILKRFGPYFIALNQGRDPLPWKEKFALPDPWNAALIARFEIDRIVGLAQMAGADDRGVGLVKRRISEFIDEWCGTPPRPKWPLPYPFPFRLEELKIGATDLVIMGMQFHKAAGAFSDAAFAAEFLAAGDRLAQTGLERLSTNGHK